ncbi:S-layer homology domain-containing protein [Nitriliruptor alkaliphilus]|uniref:S-layer homology domain-containing protein n=1 Tax=Nitriliruptor alkaliphilus TaxID=427918 RepID=UPI0006975C63|nr:S-layer homology domain-containing protein [Nitriliruptor alkaliphilus]
MGPTTRVTALVVAATAALTLTAGAGPAAARGDDGRRTTLELSPDRQVGQGQLLRASGVCFIAPDTPGRHVFVMMSRVVEPGSGLTRDDFDGVRAPVLADGSWHTALRIPDRLLPGMYHVYVDCLHGNHAYNVAERRIEVTGTDPRPRFVDVPDGYQHAEAIRTLAARGITLGCGGGRFCPTDPLTRAQAASLLARALELERGGQPTFDDVDPDSVHAGAIAALERAGIVRGCAPGRYCPTRGLRRDETATLIDRSFEPDVDGSGYHWYFTDVRPDSPHIDAIAVVALEEIMRGCDDRRFCPTTTITRAQAARTLHRALHLGD